MLLPAGCYLIGACGWSGTTHRPHAVVSKSASVVQNQAATPVNWAAARLERSLQVQLTHPDRHWRTVYRTRVCVCEFLS